MALTVISLVLLGFRNEQQRVQTMLTVLTQTCSRDRFLDLVFAGGGLLGWSVTAAINARLPDRLQPAACSTA
jgi:hypothetical protein